MNDGYIRLYRKFVEWEWYSNVNDRLVFIHCLLSANWKDGYFEGQKIPRGSFVTSYQKLAKETGLTMQSVRTSINHLKSTNNLTNVTNHQYSIITINNYDKYQDINTLTNKRLTNEQQTTNNNRINNNKERIKENISKDILKKSFVKPTLEEIIDYCNERNNGVDAERFYNFYESKGWMVGSNKMKNWKAAVRTWEQKETSTPSWFNKKIDTKESNEIEDLLKGF